MSVTFASVAGRGTGMEQSMVRASKMAVVLG